MDCDGLRSGIRLVNGLKVQGWHEATDCGLKQCRPFLVVFEAPVLSRSLLCSGE